MQEIRRFNYDEVENDPQLRVVKARFVPQTKGLPIASPVDNPGLLRGVLLSLHFDTDQTHHILGSAVLVAPGLAISAHHIFRESDDHPKAFNGVIALGHHEEEPILWDVYHVTVLNGTDLCILSMTLSSAPPREGVIRVAEMTDRLPLIGEEVFLAGYRSSGKSTQIVDNVRDINGNVYCCTGLVRNIFPKKRDSVMVYYPAAEVHFAAPSGASGGPVFDAEGRLFGVLSTSLEDPPAFISLIGPALDAPFSEGVPYGFLRPDQTLRCLI